MHAATDMSAPARCNFLRDGEYLKCSLCGRQVRSRSDVRVYAICRAGVPGRGGDAPAKRTSGPGTELKAMLAGWPLYLKTSGGCSCNRHAAQMDAWGCDECERRIDEIVGWLRDEAARRRIPFIDTAGKLLVSRAIRLARGKMGRES